MPPPPFDPELAPVVEQLRAARPPLSTPDGIAARREFVAGAEQTVDELAAAHPGFEFAEEHAEEVPLLVARPPESRGVLYYVHGGGLIVGSHLGPDVPNVLRWAGNSASPSFRRVTGSRPSTRTRRRSRTATPVCRGRPSGSPVRS